MSHDTVSFIALCIGLLIFLLVVSLVSKNYSLNRIKSKTVGDGQHGTARWATLKEIGKTYTNVQELTPHILNELIEKIVVHEREIGEDGVKTQQVDIYYKFIGCVDLRRAKADHAEIIRTGQRQTDHQTA